MINQYFNVIIEKDEDGYLVASVPSLKGCHTQAKSYDQLMERIQEAIELCLEMENEQFEPLEFVGMQRIAIKK
jgi:predicted RNase H-like HicB family nuclease